MSKRPLPGLSQAVAALERMRAQGESFGPRIAAGAREVAGERAADLLAYLKVQIDHALDILRREGIAAASVPQAPRPSEPEPPAVGSSE